MTVRGTGGASDPGTLPGVPTDPDAVLHAAKRALDEPREPADIAL